MPLAELNQPGRVSPMSANAGLADRSSSLLERTVQAMPPGARILVYPAGRNARLAVTDLREKGLLGSRTIVGYADDQPPADVEDCLSLDEAVRRWQPTHVVLCARRPGLEAKLADRVRADHAELRVVAARDAVIEALSHTRPTASRSRSLDDIDMATIVMCKTCNVRCSFCYQSNFNERMDPVIFRDKLRPAFEHARTISLVGGEVTAYRHAWPFVETIPQDYPHASLELTTNAILFDERWADLFCRTGGYVAVSAIAATPQTFREVAGQDKHAQVIDNVRRVVHMRNERRADLRISISMVITPQTQSEIAMLVELGASLGVDDVRFGVDTMTMHSLDRNLIEAQIHRIRQQARAEVHWDRLGMLYPELITQVKNTTRCTMAADSLFVEVNGDVFVCCHSHLCIGSVLEEDIETIWQSREGYAVERDVLSGQCATCPQDCEYRPATLRVRQDASVNAIAV